MTKDGGFLASLAHLQLHLESLMVPQIMPSLPARTDDLEDVEQHPIKSQPHPVAASRENRSVGGWDTYFGR